MKLKVMGSFKCRFCSGTLWHKYKKCPMCDREYSCSMDPDKFPTMSHMDRFHPRSLAHPNELHEAW